LLAAASGADAAAEALSSGIARLCSVPEAVLREEVGRIGHARSRPIVVTAREVDGARVHQ
jgi:hypothetical protein